MKLAVFINEDKTGYLVEDEDMTNAIMKGIKKFCEINFGNVNSVEVYNLIE